MGGDEDALLATFGSPPSQESAPASDSSPRTRAPAAPRTPEATAEASRGAPEATDAATRGAIERDRWLPGLDEKGRVVDWPLLTLAEPPLAHASADLAQMLHNAVAVLDTLLGALPSAQASVLQEMVSHHPVFVLVLCGERTDRVKYAWRPCFSDCTPLPFSTIKGSCTTILCDSGSAIEHERWLPV